jgi:excisionase family DNA binding protein
VGAISVTNSEMPTARLAFRVTEAATLIGVSAAFVRLEMARGNMNATRLGRRVVLTRVELDRYLASRQTMPGALGGRSAEGAQMDAAGKASVALRASIRRRGTVAPRSATR